MRKHRYTILGALALAITLNACTPNPDSTSPATTPAETPVSAAPAITAPLDTRAPDPVETGDYTPDQETSLNVYAAMLAQYCADPESGPQMRAWATPENIAAQVLEQYGFAITHATAVTLTEMC